MRGSCGLTSRWSQPGAGRTGLFAFPGWTKPRRRAREVEGRGLMRKVPARIGGVGRG
jgi:hypothetical protein